MSKIQPVEKGQCCCCTNTPILVKECIQTNCDYAMCIECYKKYYKTNTLCPACRNPVETKLINIITESPLDIGEIEMDNHIICINCNLIFSLR